MHPSVYHLLREQIKVPEIDEKVDATSSLFSKTVAQVLAVTRVLCFA